MPIIDEDGRIFALVNVVDLLATLLAIAVFAAISALALSQFATPLTAVIAVVSVAGLVLASKRHYGVSRETVVESIRDSKPSRPSFRGAWQWLTADPDPDVIVIDLRETLTVGPVIVAIEWIVDRIAALYRGSRLETAVATVGRRLRRLSRRTGLSKLIARLFSAPSPPEPSDRE